MGFFENLGNWIWEGIILNVIFGAIGYVVLVALWTLLYLFLRYLSENQVYQGLLTTDDDHPVGVVFICLITPVLVIGFIGLILGLLWACINALAIFVVNIIPFTGWGSNDASAHFDNLTYVWTIPMAVYQVAYYMLTALPIIHIILLCVVTLVCMGHLIPTGNNTGVSLGNSNSQYAALSLSIFLSVFAVFLISSFSIIGADLFEHELENHDIDDEYPEYSSQSSEGVELKFRSGDNPFDESQKSVLISEFRGGYSGEIDSYENGQFECLSMNTISDNVDAFKLSSVDGDLYHISIISTGSLNISVMGSNNYFFETIPSYDSLPTDLGQEFHSSDLYRFADSTEYVRGFDLGIDSDDDDKFQSVKYSLVYVYAPDGITSETNQSIANLTSEMTHPGDCDRYAFSGALEPRIRLSFMAYVFSGMFLLGCVIQRYFVILGHDGETEPRVLFRTFIQSQLISIGVFGIIILLFDPLDGMGITGLRMETIIETTLFASKMAILMFVIVIGLIGAIALFRQRNYIGGVAKAMLQSESEISRVEREWFSGE